MLAWMRQEPSRLADQSKVKEVEDEDDEENDD